ncbi:MAG: DoxX family membrane protein [Anaerolineae bacterium]|nr:DoxX family membrane protein [Thermoflexales bacterium]MDW8408676.1 DoxX family membrane protein [Anaerolineae bacterium]
MQSRLSSFQRNFDRLDAAITHWMARYSVFVLRVALGVVFLWFGALKFIPGLSPAQSLAARTIDLLSFGLIVPPVSMLILAAWECLIGLGLITGRFIRVTIFLLLTQMAGTLTPLFLFPTETWTAFPIAPTIEGQYIIKNLVLVAAALVIGATARGGRMVAQTDADAAIPARKA